MSEPEPGRLYIPEEYLCVCRRGHLTAPSYAGQRHAGSARGDIPRMCPRATQELGERSAILCSSTVVWIIDYPLLHAAYKLGGEDAVAQVVLAGDVDVDWPEPPNIIKIHATIGS